jgi:hypothetical protein
MIEEFAGLRVRESLALHLHYAAMHARTVRIAVACAARDAKR